MGPWKKRGGGVIEAVGLTKIYGRGAGGFRAVDALTLRVAPGELFGFLGPNGAGKTTTIKMLVGLLRPSAGHARIAGFDLQAQAAAGQAADRAMCRTTRSCTTS